MYVCEYVCSTYLNTRAALMRSPGAEATRSAGTGASEDGGLRREDDPAGFMQVADSRICPKTGEWRAAGKSDWLVLTLVLVSELICC